MATRKAAPAVDTSDLQPRRYVYLGVRLGAEPGKKVIALRLFRGNALEDRDRIYAYKQSRHRTIGGIYEGAEFGKDSCRGLDTARYKGMWEDEQLILACEAEQHTAMTLLREATLEKEAGFTSRIDRLLLPLRREYDKAMWDRAKCDAIERLVLTSLRTPPRSKE